LKRRQQKRKIANVERHSDQHVNLKKGDREQQRELEGRRREDERAGKPDSNRSRREKENGEGAHLLGTNLSNLVDNFKLHFGVGEACVL
jgi:hypothetical protein